MALRKPGFGAPGAGFAPGEPFPYPPGFPAPGGGDRSAGGGVGMPAPAPVPMPVPPPAIPGGASFPGAPSPAGGGGFMGPWVVVDDPMGGGQALYNTVTGMRKNADGSVMEDPLGLPGGAQMRAAPAPPIFGGGGFPQPGPAFPSLPAPKNPGPFPPSPGTPAPSPRGTQRGESGGIFGGSIPNPGPFPPPNAINPQIDRQLRLAEAATPFLRRPNYRRRG